MNKTSILSHTEVDGTSSVFITVDNFLDSNEINYYHNEVNNISDWKNGYFHSGRTPRLQKWYHDDNKYFANYWNNQTHERWMSNHTDDWMVKLRNKVQLMVDNIFTENINDHYMGCNKPQLNSTLINYYRDGNDYIKYHHDDEKIFGDNPTVCILTFGVERELRFKRTINSSNKEMHKRFSISMNDEENELNKGFILKPGSLFIMMGSVQKYYCHGIDKDSSITDSRYSLTFREHKN